jgi:hypothetical protein
VIRTCLPSTSKAPSENYARFRSSNGHPSILVGIMIYRLGLSLVQNEVKRLIESPTKGFHVRATIGHKIAVNCSYSNSRHYACLAIPSRHEVHLVKSHMTFVESNHIGDRRVHRESRLLDSFWQVSGGCLR